MTAEKQHARRRKAATQGAMISTFAWPENNEALTCSLRGAKTASEACWRSVPLEAFVSHYRCAACIVLAVWAAPTADDQKTLSLVSR